MAAIYLDHNATTPPAEEVIKAHTWAMLNIYSNPSTLYTSGITAKKVLDDARAKVARLIGADDPYEVVFTSGGTESDNLAIGGICRAKAKQGDHLITSMAEHKAVLRTAAMLETQGVQVTYLPVDRHGRVAPDDVKNAITSRTVLVSLMHANNEVGTLNPIAEIAPLCREAGVLLHTDAVQACGRIPLDLKTLGVDLLSLSAHKFYGPRGVGALWVRAGTVLSPLTNGGSQERGLRPGTENVAGAHAMGVAAELAMGRMEDEMVRLRVLRDRLWHGISAEIPGAKIHGDLVNSLSNTLNVSIPGWEAEKLVLALDGEGIEVGTGSACTTGQTTPSHVLLAMGVSPKNARSSLRFSLGKNNSKQDIEVVVAALSRICHRPEAPWQS